MIALVNYLTEVIIVFLCGVLPLNKTDQFVT